ncbi:MAG: isocitrate/isopropylmalate family dehydrogenase, partial [Gemmatimonadales bacterium]
DIAGKGIANPVAQMLAACMMLDHLGEAAAAERVRQAVAQALREDGVRTVDLRGDAKTSDIADAVIRRLT